MKQVGAAVSELLDDELQVTSIHSVLLLSGKLLAPTEAETTSWW